MISEILEQEEKCRLQSFDAHDARMVANSIINYVETNNLKHVGVRIKINGLLVTQILMNGKKEDKWLLRKEATVEIAGHSTLYMLEKYKVDSQFGQFIENEKYAFGGGGFPIYVNDEFIGSICVSGLEHTLDHNLIVETLLKFKKGVL